MIRKHVFITVRGFIGSRSGFGGDLSDCRGVSKSRSYGNVYEIWRIMLLPTHGGRPGIAAPTGRLSVVLV